MGGFYIKLMAFLLIAGLVSGISYAGYRYVTNLQEKNEQLTKDNVVLEENVNKLEDGIEKQGKTIGSLQRDIKKRNKIFNDTIKEFQGARDSIHRLERKLEKHDLGMLARRKPGLVEKIVNKATRNANRCFEILSGSPLTKAELAATKRSQINAECPSIANPNYKEEK